MAAGIGVADELVEDGYTACSPATWGSPTPPPSAALIAAFTGSTAGTVTGRGTGIDDADAGPQDR